MGRASSTAPGSLAQKPALRPLLHPSPAHYVEASKHQVKGREHPVFCPVAPGSVSALSWEGWADKRKDARAPGKLLFIHFLFIFNISLLSNIAHKQTGVKYQCKTNTPLATHQDPRSGPHALSWP